MQSLDRPPNMAFQRTRRPSLRSGRSLRSLGSPLNAQPFGVTLKRCWGTATLGTAVLIFVALPAYADAAQIRSFDRECGFSVLLPKGWTLSSKRGFDTAPYCYVTVQPKDWEEHVSQSDLDLPPYPISFSVSGKSLEQAAQDAKLIREGGKWVLRSGTVEDGHKPKVFSGRGWLGLRWRQYSGSRTYREGGNAGATFSTIVLIGNADRSAMIYLSEEELEPLFEEIVGSIRLLPPRGKPR